MTYANVRSVYANVKKTFQVYTYIYIHTYRIDLPIHIHAFIIFFFVVYTCTSTCAVMCATFCRYIIYTRLEIKTQMFGISFYWECFVTFMRRSLTATLAHGEKKPWAGKRWNCHKGVDVVKVGICYHLQHLQDCTIASESQWLPFFWIFMVLGNFSF